MTDSDFLQQKCHLETAPSLDMLPDTASSDLFGVRLPAGVLWLADPGTLFDLVPPQCLIQVGITAIR
ncbi:MAG: hypothetical protein EBZ29_09855 [Synechococcaceae bacterium WB9_4xC_028]|nr:hypothetical protein [Synechococcaceae bacterium WB9_4xB_025]NDD69662.1 hypothetical protein [Synechococcaceae bacterium WB9_4xC_028]